MKEIVLDGMQMKTKKDMHSYLIRKFQLPSYYGRNLDSLWDCLNEFDEKSIIIFENSKTACEYLKEYANSLILLFQDLQEENELFTFKINS